MNSVEFEQKWHLRTVRINTGKIDIPDCRYQVTAALLRDGIFSVMAEDWNPHEDRPHWYTIEFKDPSEIDQQFHISKDDELLNIWSRIEKYITVGHEK